MATNSNLLAIEHKTERIWYQNMCDVIYGCSLNILESTTVNADTIVQNGLKSRFRAGVHNSNLLAGQNFFLTYPRAKVYMF